MILEKIKRPLRHANRMRREMDTKLYLAKRLRNKQPITIENFDFDRTKTSVLQFFESLRIPNEVCQYRYSQSCSEPTLYASAYACMTHSLMGQLDELDSNQKARWVEYFDSFQDSRDGLFYDPVVLNDLYVNADWWGARHLALHMISAYTDLNARPRHPFIFLKPYYDAGYLRSWLGQYDWRSAAIGQSDAENKIMNIGCLLQYQRDAWGDYAAGVAVENIKRYLREKINQDTGMWGGFNVVDERQRSRMVVFAYHLYLIFFYDGDFDFDRERVVKIVLTTQNRFGGFGVPLNSSACEDIDSIDIIIRLAPLLSETLKNEVKRRLSKALSWVFLNQVDDGGFVFRLNEPFVYGNLETSSVVSEGAVLPTWFRSLCIAYLANFLGLPNGYKITRCPGYEF